MRKTAFAGMALVALWLAFLVRFEYHGDWSALFCVGEIAPMPAELASAYRWKDRPGYDGQYYRLIAHDPLLRRDYAEYLDSRQLRYRRILLPAAAYAAGLGNPDWIDAAYILVVIAAAGLGVWWSAAYLAAHGRNPAWGLLFLLVPGVMTSYDRMLVDGLLTALFVGFMHYATRGHWRKAWVAIALAALTRETGMFLVAGAVAHWLLQRRFRQAAAMGAAAVPALAWYAFLASRLPYSGSPPGLFRLPVWGHLQKIAQIAGDPSYPIGMLVLDTLALAGLLVSALLAATAIRRKPAAVGVTVLLFALAALSAGHPNHLREAYGYARPVSPMLAYLMLGAVAFRTPLLATAPLAVCASVAARVFVQPFLT